MTDDVKDTPPPVAEPDPVGPPTQPTTEELAAKLSETVLEEAETERLVTERLRQLGEQKMPTAIDIFHKSKGDLEVERSSLIAMHLGEQTLIYERASRQDLIDALVDRDHLILQLGRQVQEGKLGGRLLREFVRGILTAADKGSPEQIERVLRQLGAEPADSRQLRLKGTTL